MDIFIPATAEAAGAHFAALLAVDPARRAVFPNIVLRLEQDGRLGDRARFYIVRQSLRRATLRSILGATGQAIPEWARESRAASRINEAFVADYRDAYNEFRKEVRALHKEPAVAA